MKRIRVAAFLAVGWIALVPMVAAQGQQTDPCVNNPNGPKCIGRWMEPIELCGPDGPIGCNKFSPECEQGACTTGCNAGDEIAHSALIPSGPRAGQVLLWTRCDRLDQNPAFRSYFWDPVSQLVTGDAPFPPSAADAFCAGHTWILDGEGKAKLLTAGGSVTNRIYWFDAETAAWNPGSDPVDLPGGDTNYYPSVVTYGDDATQSSVVGVIGGTAIAQEPICPPTLYQKWWSLTSPFTSGSWTVHPTSNTWFQYPRALLLSQNMLFSAGHVVTCEDAIPDPYQSQDWGGNPAQIIDLVTGAHQDLPNVDPNVVFAAGFPRGPHQPIRGWNYDNALVMHTLKASWAWNNDPTVALTQYNLDRVLAFGGVPKLEPAGFAYDAHSVAMELQGAASLPAGQWSWLEKDRAAIGRATGNWVLLPTGQVLAVGGSFRVGINLNSTEMFDPKGPTQAGSFRAMHSRPIPSGLLSFIPRIYHSTALLVPSGEVVLMGGTQTPNQPDSMHTLEVFRPPYMYYTGRPTLNQVPETIHYPSGSSAHPFLVKTNSGFIQRAALLGVGSVTHHFDYGQRYVELMVRDVLSPPGHVQILPPPKSSMAPPGYYMLFLVDGFGLPSVGKLVRLDYLRS